MLRDKQNVLILLGSLIFAALVAVIIMLAIGNGKTASNSGKTDPFDPTFEMMDPENPLGQVDKMAKAKTKSNALQKEQDYIEKLLWNTKNKLQSITDANFPKSFSDAAGLTNEGRDFLNRYSVSSLFDEQSADLYTYKMNAEDNPNETLNIYLTARDNYSMQLRKKFMDSKLPWDVYAPYYIANYYSQPAFGRDSNQPALSPILPPLQSIPGLAKGVFESLSSTLTQRKAKITDDMATLKTKYDAMVDNYKKSRFDMSGNAIKWGIVAFVLIAVVLYIAGLNSRNKLRQGANPADTSLNDYLKTSTWYSVYLITVLLLIISIFILGLGRFLGENSLAALLGGIAGYVLNSKIGDPAAIAARQAANSNTGTAG